jgi:phosphoglycolate phosphatase-like HAD superfamily hydrolase
LYLASGTDEAYVRNEVKLLQLAPYFEGRVYGAIDDYKRFSKQLVIQQILDEHGIQGDELLAFGDGFVEIEETKKVGGFAVAVASDEAKRAGINYWKRERLVRAGADLVIPDYRDGERLLRYLFGEGRS